MHAQVAAVAERDSTKFRLPAGVEVVSEVLSIPTDLIVVLEQPRDGLNWDYIKTDLAPNIQRNGQKEPGIVIPTDDSSHPYGLIKGQHRLESCKLNGRPFQAVVVNIDVNDRKGRKMLAIGSNWGRLPHTPLEAARNIQELLDLGAIWTEVCDTFQKSEPWLRDRLALLKLTDAVKRRVISGELPVSVAKEIAELPPADQAKVATSVMLMATGRAVEKVKAIVAGQQGAAAAKPARPRDVRRSLIRHVERVGTSLQRALDIPVVTLKAIFPKASDATTDFETIIRVLTRSLEDLGKLLERLKKLDPRPKKPDAAPDGKRRQEDPKVLAARVAEERRREVMSAIGSLVLVLQSEEAAIGSSFAGKDPDIHDDALAQIRTLTTQLGGLAKRISGSKESSRF
ncbi:MAG: ParB N-terminal domain-containing protein [Patescibacteria group bacterium]|jgi:ParB/RepB/Spo0J family partition protein